MNLKSILIAIFISICFATTVWAKPPDTKSQSVILLDPVRDQVLYEKNSTQMMYPASVTKIVTAMVLLDYFEPEEIVIVGDEINTIPKDSSKAWHVVGERISIQNLLRGLMLRSGNDSSCVIAMSVAKRIDPSVASYDQAEEIFADQMNRKAAEIGVLNTNFVNPHGYHDDQHYTTAYDLALITKAAMAYPLIQACAVELSYEGMSVEGMTEADITEDTLYIEHVWANHNALILDKGYYYPYATGLKTGYTSNAGNCFAGTAEKDGEQLIVVLLNAEESGDRWNDAIVLFEYGFNEFGNVVLHEKGELLLVAPVDQQAWGEPSEIQLAAFEDKIEYMEFSDADQVEMIVEGIFDEEGHFTKLPVAAGDIVGTVTYMLNGEILLQDMLVSMSSIKDNSIYNNLIYIRNYAISTEALPYWVISVTIILIAIGCSIKINSKRKRRKYYY